MIRRQVAIALLCLAVRGLQAQAYLDGTSSTDVPDGTTSVRSSLMVMQMGTHCGADGDCILGITGKHSIHMASGSTVRERSFNVSGTYRATYSTNGSPNQCYYTRGDAVLNYYNPPYGATGPVILDKYDTQSNQACVAPVYKTCTTDQYICDATPIIISLRGDYQLTSAADGVRFDINADGVRDRVAWTARSSGLAFLALDRNHNGRIDDGSELFGNHTPFADGTIAANGWDALTELDANGDGVVAAGDAQWSNLLLWIDGDHDGVSDANELMPIAGSAILAISTEYRAIGRRDPYGNLFRFQGEIILRQGRHTCYDVILATAP